MKTGLLIFLGAIFFSSASLAEEIAIGLTEDTVEVGADFSGAKIVLFGALTGSDAVDDISDIVAVVRGPNLSFTLRPIEKNGFVWTAGEAIHIEDAPGLYLTTSTRPLEEFTTPALREEFKLGLDTIDLAGKTSMNAEPAHASHAAAGFIAAETRSGRYRDAGAAINFAKPPLFSIDIDLPPNTPVGDYAVEVFLIRDNAVVSADSAALSVRKVGLERRIYELAHNRPLGYGIICVAVSLLAGWLAAAAFRK